VIRTLLQVVVLPDRTRVFGNLLGRYRRLGHAVIVIYGVVIAIVASVQYVQQHDPDGVWPVYFFLTAGPFGLMIFSPLAAWRMMTLALLVDRLVFGGREPLLSAWQWCAYVPILLAVALHYSRPVVVAVGWLTLGGLLFVGVLKGVGYYPESAIVLLLVLLLGYTFGARGRAEQEVERERAEMGALVERARIAREMHDVVAHHMSLVVVRCETAPYRIADLPEAGVREFAELGAAAREAITDMQRLLGVLRSGDQQADRAPQPGLPQIRGLVGRRSTPGTARTGRAGGGRADRVPDRAGSADQRGETRAWRGRGRRAPTSGQRPGSGSAQYSGRSVVGRRQRARARGHARTGLGARRQADDRAH
jgi:signal transduction histidine kinase